MKVAYVFSTPNSQYILKNMIIPQLQRGSHGFTVVGMFFFLDNTYMLKKGDEIGEALSAISQKTGMLVMGCDKCVEERGLKELADGIHIGCFPDLHEALGGSGVEQVITL